MVTERPRPAPADTMHRPLVAVTHQEWAAAEITRATAGDVIRSYGLDLPRVPHGSSWWMPPQFAARLTRAGHCPPLTAPGPTWLDQVSDTHRHLTGREVRTVTVADLATLPGPGWVKPAQAKVVDFPAAWRTPQQAAQDAQAAALPHDALAQWSPTDLRFDIEVRAYVLHGMVTTTSTYLMARMDYSALLDRPVSLMYARDAKLRDIAVRFAQHAVDAMEGQYPAGWVLDVGYSRVLDRWVVVEANAAWACAWYDADLPRVRACIDAACPQTSTHVGAREHHDWAWAPDPVEVAAASARGVLPGGVTDRAS